MDDARAFERKILDHGYLRFVESWGSDRSIVEAARMSTDKGFLGWGPKCEWCGLEESAKSREGMEFCPNPAGNKHSWDCATPSTKPGDEKLLKYLRDHRHETPFEFAGCVVEVQAPIFVFREWHRHRTQSYNEMSARYTPLPDLNYIPTVERLMLNSKTNKQAGTAKDAEVLVEYRAKDYQCWLSRMYSEQEELYQKALRIGVPKELARVHLPVGRYSRMRASTSLRNWLGFLTLRMDKNAQFEIRQFANAMGELLKELFPKTWELFALSHHGTWDEGVS